MRFSALLSALLIAACTTGTPFTKPSDDRAIVLGRTTLEQVMAQYGEPKNRQSEMLATADAPAGVSADPFAPARVGGMFETVTYNYSDKTKASWVPGASWYFKSVTYRFWNKKLVSYYFIGNFEEDQMPTLDDAAVNSIATGKTTLADLEKMFGKPFSRGIYPATQREDLHWVGFAYLDLYFPRGPNNPTISTIKRLDVLLNHDNIVENVRFQTNNSAQ